MYKKYVLRFTRGLLNTDVLIHATTTQTVINTPPISEIIWVINVRAIVVCGFLMK